MAKFHSVFVNSIQSVCTIEESGKQNYLDTSSTLRHELLNHKVIIVLHVFFFLLLDK